MPSNSDNSDKATLEFMNIIKGISKVEASKVSSTITFGEVTKVEDDDLRISIENGNILSHINLVLSDRCKPRFINIPYEDDNTHIHGIEAALSDMQGVTAMGPVTFMMSNGPATIPDPSFTGDGEPPMIPNPALSPSPILSLSHIHKVKPALAKIKLWRGLEVGDIVVMMRMSNGKYFVLERAGYGDEPSNAVYNKKVDGDEDNPDK